MTNPSIKSALEVTELENRHELTVAGADAVKNDDNSITVTQEIR